MQLVAGQFHEVDKSLARIGAAVFALKAILALQINPSAPSQALKMIQDLENEIAKIDPNRSARERTDEVLEMLRLMDKHGAPKQA